MKYLVIALGLIVSLAVAQAAYTIAIDRFCAPHYQSKRIQFWSLDSLSTSWEMDLLGLQTQAIQFLLERNTKEMDMAFASGGNIGNPGVKALRPHFVKALDETSFFFQRPEKIES